MASGTSDEELDEFLDQLGKKAAMQDDFVKEALAEPILITQLPPAAIVQNTLKKLNADHFNVGIMPPVGKTLEMAGTQNTNDQQKQNIEIISYALYTQGIIVTPDEIWKAWPTEGDPYKLQRSGKRPSLTAITQYTETDLYKENVSKWGISLAVNDKGLTDEQLALLDILSNTSKLGGLQQRLKKAGVSASKFRAWKRQRAFSEAMKRLVQYEREDAADNVDIQLISMAQNGNLNAIKYYNDLVGRGPNDKKAVDAMQFSKIILESVMKHVTPEQLKAISAEVEFASKQMGI